jgi:hypothetical protein
MVTAPREPEASFDGVAFPAACSVEPPQEIRRPNSAKSMQKIAGRADCWRLILTEFPSETSHEVYVAKPEIGLDFENSRSFGWLS